MTGVENIGFCKCAVSESDWAGRLRVENPAHERSSQCAFHAAWARLGRDNKLYGIARRLGKESEDVALLRWHAINANDLVAFLNRSFVGGAARINPGDN